MSALVFNCSYNGLGIIRALGRRGVEVYALDSVRGIRAVGTYSRYAKYVMCPDPLIAEDAFVDCLMDMGKQFPEPAVLYPTNDEWAGAISRRKDMLSKYYLPCVPDWPAFELAVQKRQFYAWALERGYAVPKTCGGMDFRNGFDMDFPVVAKPHCRRICSNEEQNRQHFQFFSRERLQVFRDKDELNQFIDENQQHLDDLLIQEYVEGLSDQMHTVGVYADSDHEVLGVFTGRKVRGFPPDIGDCIVGQVETVPRELVEIAKSLCKDMKFSGIGEFEFKRDVNKGEFKLIELNPRSWSWVGITPHCGVDLPWIAYQDLTNPGSVSYVETKEPTGSVKWVRVLDDFANCRTHNRRVGYPQWAMGFRQWRQSLRAKKLVSAEFAWGDLRPGLFVLVNVLSKMHDRVRNKLLRAVRKGLKLLRLR